MAVSTNIITERVGFDSTTNTSTIKVTVVADYNSGSYNNTNKATGTLNINGVNYDYVGNFGSPTSQSGSSTLYETIIVLDHNVTNELDCTNIYNSGVSSGTVGSSKFITYEGTASDDDYGVDDVGSITHQMYSITITKTAHCEYRYISPSGELLEFSNYPRFSKGYTIKFDAIVDENYNLAYFLVNGQRVDPKTPYVINEQIILEAVIVSSVTHISQEVQEFPYYNYDCIFNGHDHLDGMAYYDDGAEAISPPKYSTTTKKSIGWSNYGEPYRPAYFLKMTIPNFQGKINKIYIDLGLPDASLEENNIEYWFTSSDENYIEYAAASYKTNPVVNDENIIETGKVFVEKKTPLRIVVRNKGIQPNTSYYLIVFCQVLESRASIDPAGISIKMDSFDSISTGSHIEYIPYEVYIENEEEWNKYAPYIDDGEKWTICS